MLPNNKRTFPWQRIAIVLLVAGIIYAGLAAYAASRIVDARRSAEEAQQARLNQAALRIEDYLGVALQLAKVAAVVVSREKDRTRVGQDAESLLSASDKHLIFGIGAFYVPFALDRATPKYGAYAYRDVALQDQVIPVNASSAYAYVDRPWYVNAMNAAGRPVFTGPYTSPHGVSFIGASQSFSHAGNVVGVVLVDASHGALNDLLLQSVTNDDVAYVTDKNGHVIVGEPTDAGKGVDSVASTEMHLAPWRLHLASRFPAVDAAARNAPLAGIPLSIAYWFGVAMVLVVVVRTKQLQDKAAGLQEKVLRDELTGLHNRAYLMKRLGESLGIFKIKESDDFVVLYIDIDGFALVNDSFGHSVGDDLLRLIAERIERSLWGGADSARLGGDEFVVWMQTADMLADGRRMAAELVEQLSVPFHLGEHKIFVSASIGIVVSNPRYSSADEILRDADTAMYAAKRAGRSRFAVFDEAMHKEVLARLSLENNLRVAIENDDIFVCYQPLINAATGTVASIESLARCRATEQQASMSAAEFIPVAEQSGMIGGIDAIVLIQACMDCKRLQERFPGTQVAVNLSATHLNHGNVEAQLLGALANSGLDARLLTIELTETAIMEKSGQSLAVLHRLRQIGCEIVIDDFGTGQSSLSYLQQLPVSGLKIDKAFIEPMVGNERSAEIVRAVVALGRTLNLHITAEGVETVEQFEMLRTMGVDFIQGYYFAKPVPYEELEAIIASRGSQEGVA